MEVRLIRHIVVVWNESEPCQLKELKEACSDILAALPGSIPRWIKDSRITSDLIDTISKDIGEESKKFSP